MYSIIGGNRRRPPARRADCFLRGRDLPPAAVLLDIAICRHGGSGLNTFQQRTLLAVRMLKVREKRAVFSPAQHAPSRANAARFYPSAGACRIFE